MAFGFGTALEQSMLGSDLSSALSSPANKQQIIVPVPVAAPTETKGAKKPAAGKAQASQPMPTMQLPNFGPTPTFQQDAVPAVPQQPVWHEELGRYLNGQPLASAVQAPTYAGFGMPVFSDAQAFAMTPEQYNNVLDTTKNNIAFNNKVAGDNYNNTLNIIRTLQQADQVEQEQYSRNLQNRGAVLQGNKMQQDIAYDQSPQQKAKMSNQLNSLSDNRHEQIATRAAAREQKYRIELQNMHDARTEKQDAKKGKAELSNLLLKRDIDIWGDAVKGFTTEELELVTKAGSSNILEQLMTDNPNIKPLSRYNLRAAYEAQQRIKASGGNVGSIFSETGRESKTSERKPMSLDEALKKYPAK